MIRNLVDFEESTVFERHALSTIQPLVSHGTAQNDDRALLDLRSRTTTVLASSVDDVAASARDKIIFELRPLLFGAAWKILDALMEYGLTHTGAVPGRREWSIKEKQEKRVSAAVAPLSGHPDLWERIGAVYANTVEARHCLIHRSFRMTESGDITELVDNDGKPVPDLTALARNSIVRLSQRLAHSVLTGRLSNRDRLELVATLDQLNAVHSRGALGGGAAPQNPPETVVVDATETEFGWVVDITRARNAAEGTFPARSYFDIEVHFPGTGLPPLRGRLEDAPYEAAVPIDPAKPPEWIDL